MAPARKEPSPQLERGLDVEYVQTFHPSPGSLWLARSLDVRSQRSVRVSGVKILVLSRTGADDREPSFEP